MVENKRAAETLFNGNLFDYIYLLLRERSHPTDT
jgi:hypothetical protein